MVGLRYLPIKSSVLVTFSLSLSLAVAGCVASTPDTVKQVVSLTPASITSGPQPQARPLPESLYRYDWTHDRISEASASFKTQAFRDAVRPSFSDPAPEQQSKSTTVSGGLSSEFAKNLPGSDGVDHLPNTPAIIGTNSYYLTASATSTNAFGLNSSGQVLWQLSLHENNGRFIGTSPALGDVGGVNTLYALSSTGRLYAINASTGIVRGFVDISEEEFEYTSPWVIPSSTTGSLDNIYVAGSKEGRIYKYTFNGTSFTQIYNPKVVSSSNTGKFKASPIVTGVNRHIYIGSEEGRFYKLREDTGATVSNLDLKTLTRSEACQVRATAAIDAALDTAIVPCGSYVFKVRLTDASSTTNLSLVAQSPLLEIRDLAGFKPMRVLGPNVSSRTMAQTTLERDPEPSETEFTLSQRFGFKNGDFIRIITQTGYNTYGTIDTIDEKGAVTIREDSLFPIPSPSPDPFLIGGETVSVVNYSVRPTPLPSPDATPTPTPTPTALGADQVFQFKVGNPEGLSEGDALVFPTLPGSPIATICSSSNPDCDKDSTGTNRHPGIEIALDENGELPTDTAKIVYQINLPDPGGTLQAAVQAKLHTDKYVPFEKVMNRVMGNTNSTIEFELGSVAEFNPGQTIRITHNNGSLRGRYEYGVIDTVSSSTRRIRLISPLTDAPSSGDRIEIIDPNPVAYGRVVPTQKYSSGNILSAPVLRGNGQHVYVQHGNVLFELDYANDSNFRDQAKYTVLQSARLDSSNLAFSAQSRAVPLVLSTDKLITVDSDPIGKTGIFLNRILLPLDFNNERLNDVFPISTPNALGFLPKRAETRPVQLGGGSDYIVIAGGNGIVYKLHKDMAW